MKKKKKGMTLVELIAAMSIFVLVAMAITSTLVFSIKLNSNNRTKFQSNANSRTFVEAMNVGNNKPDKPGGSKDIEVGYYYLGFNDQSKINDLVKNFATTTKSASSSAATPTFDSINAAVGTGNKYIMAIKVDWDITDKIYVFDIWSWDVSKGNISEISRRMLIAPK